MTFNYCTDIEHQNAYTVCMRHTPPGHDVAAAIFATSKEEAIAKAARQWGCKPADCFIYGDDDGDTGEDCNVEDSYAR